MRPIDSTWQAALRIALIYAVVSSLWILFSDQLVLLLFTDPVLLTTAQSIKGWAFVTASALLIFILLRRELVQVRQTQFELDEHKSFLNAMLDNSPAIMYMKDKNGRYIFANRHFCSIYHIDRAELEGKTDFELFPEEVAGALRENDERVLDSSTTFDFRETIPHPDGALRTYLSVKFPVLDRHGKATGVCGISSDITEREELERKLEQNERLNALGRLTGGIAHDFNNHLTVIRGNLELLRAKVAGSTEDSTSIQHALHASTQAASLVDRLLSFSRNQILNLDNVDVNSAVAGMRDLLARSLGGSIRFEFSICPGDQYCLVDPVQLESALLNLAVNARDAMPGGGTLSIRTRREAVSAMQASKDDIESGDYVRIEVEDTGEGISPELLTRVLEPFFTTKGPGKGTGLGLSMVEGFARQSGGCLRIKSRLGSGTLMALVLPRAEYVAPSGPEKLDIPAHLPAGRGETVLVVEDQASLRLFATRVLDSHGYKVLSSEDGNGAFRVMAETPNIDLLFSDIILPGGVLGPELAHKFGELYPRGRVLLTSGYAEASLIPAGGSIPSHQLLKKPYGVTELLQSVNDVLRAP